MIEFQHVSFAYEKNVPVLKDLSFRIDTGERRICDNHQKAVRRGVESFTPRVLDRPCGNSVK